MTSHLTVSKQNRQPCLSKRQQHCLENNEWDWCIIYSSYSTPGCPDCFVGRLKELNKSAFEYSIQNYSSVCINSNSNQPYVYVVETEGLIWNCFIYSLPVVRYPQIKIIVEMYTITKTVITKCFCTVLTWCVPQAELNTLVFQLQTGCVVLKHSGDIRLETDHRVRSQDRYNCYIVFFTTSCENLFTTSDGPINEFQKQPKKEIRSCLSDSSCKQAG